MSRRPFFSIITPTYNHERYITACIESVLAQTCADWEMIVIDDASSDGTAALLRDYMRREPRITLIRHDRRWGMASLHQTYNQGLDISTGKWIAVLEGDDVWPADKLAIQHGHCLREQAVVCFGTCLLLSPQGQVIADVQLGLPRPFRRYFRDYRGSLTRALLQRPGFIHPVTAVIDREALRQTQGFQHYPGLRLTDYPTFLELSLLGPFFGSRQRLGFYRRHQGSQSLVRIVELTAYEKKFAFYFHEKISRHAANTGKPAGARAALAMKRSWAAETARSFWVDGRRLHALNKKKEARAAFKRGLTCEPIPLWFGLRTLTVKAACLLAVICLDLHINPDNLAAGVRRRRKSLLQEALAPEKKMKILLVNYLFHPYASGGAERAALDLARNLSRKGCRVLVMTAGSREERFDLQPGLSVWRIFHRSPYFNAAPDAKKNIFLRTAWRLLAVWNPLIFFRTVSILRHFRPDIVHVHNFHGFSPSVFSAARLLSIPVAFTPHDYFSICRRYSLFRNGKSCGKHCFGCRLWSHWTRHCLGRFHLLSFSRFSRELFLHYLRPASAQVLYHASPMNRQDMQRAAAQKRRLAEKKKTIFLFMGRLDELKGIRWLLDSLQGEMPPQTFFFIAGDGPLRSLSEEFCGLRPLHFRFLGEVSGASKHRLLLATDVLFCLSAAGDMSPLVIPEAFSYGIPVIGTAVGAIAEWIVPNETGWLVADGDREGLAAIVSEIGAQRGLAQAYRDNCIRKAAAQDRDHHLQALLNYFGKISRPDPDTS